MTDDTMPRGPAVFGILYPGEMGCSLGGLLRDAGFRVVTTLERRSPRTRTLCQRSGLVVLDTVADLVRQSEIIFSLVTPSAALEAAEAFARHTESLSYPPTYVDANSISPCTAEAIAQLLADCNIDFVDAAIHGLASKLRSQGTLYLSGPSALHLANILG